MALPHPPLHGAALNDVRHKLCEMYLERSTFLLSFGVHTLLRKLRCQRILCIVQSAVACLQHILHMSQAGLENSVRISRLLERLRARVQERVAINWSTALGTGFLHGLATIMTRVMKALFLTATIALTRQQRRLSDSRSLRGS